METGNTWIALAMFSPLLPLLAAGWRWLRLDVAQRLLLGWVLLEVFFDLGGRYMASTLGNNHPLMHGYVALELAMLLGVFHFSLRRLLGRYALPIVMGLFALFVVVNGLLWQPFDTYASIPRLGESLLLVIVGMLWFYDVFQRQEIERLEKTFHFWFTVGVVLYFSCNVVLWAFGDLGGKHQPEYFVRIWTVHAVSNIFLHLIYTLALWQKPKA